MRLYGRPMERPMPQNIVGLPPADQVLEELAYAQSFAPQPEAAPADRPVEIRQGGRTTFRQYAGTSIEGLPRGRRGEGFELDRREADQAIQEKMQQQAVFDALAAGTDPGEVFSGVIGRPVSPSIAGRAGQYMEILNLKPAQALKLAEQEAISAGSPRGRVTLPSNWIQAIAESGELGPDPAAQGALRAAMQGAIDVETPVEAQTRALDPYMRAAEAVAMAPQNRFQTLSPGENADINLETGANRKLRGGKRNPMNKEVKESVSDPYLVPVLMAEASEPVWQKDSAGKWQQSGVQPPTIVVGQTPEGRKQRVFDASAVQLALLDPRAQLPAEMGYLRFAEPKKEVSGSYGAEVNAPTLQRLGDELHGFAARDDIATAKESVPMTLGQAVQDIMYRNRTPIKAYREDDLAADNAGQLYHRQTGTPVYLIPNQGEDLPVKDYRIGTPGMYNADAFREFGELIQGVTGRPLKLVTNERLRDPELNRLQRAALARSMPASWISQAGPRKFGPEDWRVNPLPGSSVSGMPNAASVPIEGNNPTYDVMTALARGASLPEADTWVTPMANAPAELAFYLDDGNDRPGLGLQSRLNALHNAALSQSRAYLISQIPEGARGNVEAGLQAPASSPRYKAAKDFLQRFLARR